MAEITVTPSPIDPAELTSVLDPEGSGTMLPRTAYVSEEVFAWEREVLVRRGWICAGRADDLSESGQQRAVAVADEGVLLVRGGDGVLRGFSNVCRHRGHELLPCGGTATAKAIVCPYHAWVFDHDGSLKGVPRLHRDDVPDRTPYSLFPVRVEEWHGFVMVNLSGDAAPLAEHLADLDPIMERYSVADLRLALSHSYEIEANWKLIVENYHECFHCSSIHPELCQVSSPNSGDSALGHGSWIGGDMTLIDGNETMAFDGRSHGVWISTVPPERRDEILYLQVTPNLLVSLHPDYMMTHRLEPLAAGRSRIECAWYFPTEAFELPDFDPAYAADFWDLTNRQDWGACESVQRGLATRAFTPGPFSSFHEIVVHAFTEQLGIAYRDGMPIPPQPPPASLRAFERMGADALVREAAQVEKEGSLS